MLSQIQQKWNPVKKTILRVLRVLVMGPTLALPRLWNLVKTNRQTLLRSVMKPLPPMLKMIQRQVLQVATKITPICGKSCQKSPKQMQVPTKQTWSQRLRMQTMSKVEILQQMDRQRTLIHQGLVIVRQM
uniref:Uncharacterized protein n=1 Tax=Opuntia streptacantha TaxID=393608 RepID=A0A7C8ZZM3_OPUST